MILFRDFPFLNELAARERQPELTAPTITFTDQSTGSVFAVWSETPSRFVLWLPSAFALARDVTDRNAVEKCIALFFDGTTDDLAQLITELGSANDTRSRV